jgi:hypothetical protein
MHVRIGAQLNEETMKIFSGMLMFTTWDVRLAEEKLRAAGFQTRVRAQLADSYKEMLDDDYYETTWMEIWRPSEVDLRGHVTAIVKPFDGEVQEHVLEDEAEYRAWMPRREAYWKESLGPATAVNRAH